MPHAQATGGAATETTAPVTATVALVATSEGVIKQAASLLRPQTVLGTGGGVMAPEQLEFVRQGRTFQVVASSADADHVWAPTLTLDQAGWLDGTLANLVFCLPPQAAPLVHQTQRGDDLVVRAPSGSARHYMVQGVVTVGVQRSDVLGQTRAGLTAVLCETGGTVRQVLQAVYRGDAPAQAVVGQPVGLGRLATVQVAGTQVVTPAAALPPGMMEVAVRVHVQNLQPQPLNVDALIDELQIAGQIAEVVPDGSQPPVPPHGTADVAYRYRVPAQGGPAVWQVEHGLQESAQVALMVPTPTNP
jgi:hypothetical protein